MCQTMAGTTCEANSGSAGITVFPKRLNYSVNVTLMDEFTNLSALFLIKAFRGSWVCLRCRHHCKLSVNWVGEQRERSSPSVQTVARGQGQTGQGQLERLPSLLELKSGEKKTNILQTGYLRSNVFMSGSPLCLFSCRRNHPIDEQQRQGRLLINMKGSNAGFNHLRKIAFANVFEKRNAPNVC